MSFRLLDVNGDGELNEDEFVEGCMRDKSLAELLNAGTWLGCSGDILSVCLFVCLSVFNN